jgi:release factor glutamine methyltransferase
MLPKIDPWFILWSRVISSMKISEAIQEGAQTLRNGGVTESRREAGSLLSFVLGRDRTFLISRAEEPVDEDLLAKFRESVERRANGEPLQYIVGFQDFFGRQFRVTPDVLIPRPETELLVEAALELAGSVPFICDVGTGSGCIAITLLCEIEGSNAVAVDIAAAALEVAKLNANNLSVTDRIVFAISDCFDSLSAGEYQFDLIVSNPPYVAGETMAGLQREVKDHEPLLALSPGLDGLTVVRRLLVEAPPFLKAGGHMLIEIGFDQGEAVRTLVDESVWDLLEIRPDLHGIPRVVVLKKK